MLFIKRDIFILFDRDNSNWSWFNRTIFKSYYDSSQNHAALRSSICNKRSNTFHNFSFSYDNFSGSKRNKRLSHSIERGCVAYLFDLTTHIGGEMFNFMGHFSRLRLVETKMNRIWWENSDNEKLRSPLWRRSSFFCCEINAGENKTWKNKNLSTFCSFN